MNTIESKVKEIGKFIDEMNAESSLMESIENRFYLSINKFYVVFEYEFYIALEDSLSCSELQYYLLKSLDYPC